MDKLRKLHNDIKRRLITGLVSKNSTVLDVGSGRGGDLAKWKAAGAKVTMIDPDVESVKEARQRATTVYPETYILMGDVCLAPDGPYDYICYNFSLQYIFKTESYMEECIDQIAKRLKPGGSFFGIAPNANRILDLPEKWTDSLGNTIERGPSIGKSGERCGEMILVRLAGGPYYAAGAIPEPLCYFNMLNRVCFKHRLALFTRVQMVKEPTGTISDIYDQFIFKKLQ